MEANFSQKMVAPGRGEGTLCGSTASQLSLVDLCSLNCPAKASLISLSLYEQTAEPPMEFGGVVKTP